MMAYLDTPVFGITITILVFSLCLYLSKRFKLTLLNPILLSIIIIVVLLLLFKIDYSIYNNGGSIITFFLGPATVVLIVPLYNQLNLLKKNLFSILIGISVGCIAGIVSIIILSKLFNLDHTLLLSLIPKSTTTAIAIDISKEIGGNPALTVAFVSVTGIGGYVFGEKILSTFKITNSIAKGIAMGTTSHAVGTAKAIEFGEVEGAMSSLAIAVAGLITVFLAPLIIDVLSKII